MRISAGLLTLILGANMATAAIKTETISYTYNGVNLKGTLAYDDAQSGKRPAVMIVHEWWGLNDYVKKRATMLAELGYVAFAADMFGDAKTTDHPEDAGKMMSAVQKNVAEWRGRAEAGLQVLRGNPHVDPDRLAVIGYCFGGATALQLALSGADVKAAVSFHGSLPKITANDAKKIKAKVLICHGAMDKFISEETAQKFREALDAGGVNYEMCYYGGAVHGFTVPGSEARHIPGIGHNADADRRSWASMKRLFDEVFAK